MKTKIFLLAAVLSTGMVCTVQAQWSLTGNSLTSPGTNFIGTTDGQALIIKTDNTERVNISSSGTVTLKSPLGTGSESMFIINGGTTTGTSLVNQFEIKNSGSWLFKNQWGSSVMGYNGSTGIIYSSSGTDVDFSASGSVYATNVGAVKVRGTAWYQTEIILNSPLIEYRPLGANYVPSGSSAHKFTVGSTLTESGVNLASFDNGGSPYMVITKDGNVGIGTATPSAKLHISGGESWFSAEERNILIYNTDNSQFIGGMGRNTANAALSVASVLSDLELTAGGSAGHIRLNTLNGNKDITLQPTRSVGINTTSPNSDAKLDVNGNVFASGKVAIANTAPGDYHLKVNGKSSLIGTVDVGSAFGDNSVALSVGSDAAYLLGMYTSGGSPRMKVDQNGSIDITGGIGNLSAAGTGYFMTRLGVGTSMPNTNAKLDVNGNIFTSGKVAIGTTDMTKISDYSLVVNGEALFTKARVKLYSNWPDYVFEDKYGLLPVAQLEQYIKTNKHLPGIPSAAEVAKEGIDLGGSQAQLLQKIEELTLYIIDQDKRMETLQKKVEKLEKNNP